MKTIVFRLMAIVAFVTFSSCGESSDTVESGTYQGTVKEVEASKTEIYVETADEKTLELYFTEETELTRNGNEVEFSELEEGQKVEVEIKKTGKRLDPLSVTILE